MTLHQWLGLACTVAVIGVVVFAFRKGKSVKPNKNRKNDDWLNIKLGGSS